ncbi:MAG: DUF4340 domain-containing protein [Bryobacterales bacterium]|nr:DUF4340 domain-containing protein [Bryobacterales bacterium]
MKVRGLLVAVVLLAALTGLVVWSNKHEKAAQGKPSPDAPPKILEVGEDQFKSVTLRKGEQTTRLSRSEAGKWEIVEPKPLPADQDSVSSLVSTLSSLTSDRLIEEKAADLNQYGLAKPSLQVDLTKKDGKTENLLLGDDTPTGSAVFAKLRNDPRVFTVSSYIKSSLDKTSKDLRDKRLLTFDSEKLTRVELRANNAAIEFGKNSQNEWQIVKPRPLRADGTQVDELVRKLKDAKMDTSIADDEAAKAPAKFAASAPVANASVTDAGGVQHIEVRKDKDNNYWARSSVVEGVYRLTSDVGDGLNKNLEQFRNKKLFDFGWNDPTKVQVGQTTYSKSGDKWMSGSKQMDAPSVQSLIDKLRDLAAIKFLDQAPAGQPVLEATVTSNDGKRVEKVTVSKQGNSYYARRENEPSIYELDGKAVEELQKAAGEVKEFQPSKDQKKKS